MAVRWLWKNGPSSQPIDEPLEALDDGGDRRVGRALAIGVLDPQDEGAAVAAGVEEIEERGAGAADVEVAARARGEAGAGGVEVVTVSILSHGGHCLVGRPRERLEPPKAASSSDLAVLTSSAGRVYSLYPPSRLAA